MSDAFITVATFSHPFEAEVLRTKLESEGIRAFIRNQHIVRMNWLYSAAVGGVEVQVRERDVRRAREVMDTDMGEDLAGSEEFD